MKFRDEWKWLLPILAVCIIVFANGVGGGFIYDDNRQILRNTLIQGQRPVLESARVRRLGVQRRRFAGGEQLLAADIYPVAHYQLSSVRNQSARLAYH